VYVLLVVPRNQTFLSNLGKYTLYPYLFHEFFNFARDRLVLALKLPVSTDMGVHALFYVTGVLWSVLVFCICASPPFRFLFSPFFEFSWLKARLFAAVPATDARPAIPAIPPVSERSLGGNVMQQGNCSELPYYARTEGAETVPADTSQTDGDFGIFTSPFQAFDEERKFFELPRQKAAEKYYKVMFYSSLVLVLAFYIGVGGFLLPNFISPLDTMTEFLITNNSFWAYLARFMLVIGIAGGVLGKAISQIIRMRRLARGLEPTPALANPSGLLHCVVICTYKEPLSVLRMTVGSLAKQSFDPKGIYIVLATEARDSTAEESFGALQEEYGATFGDMMMTVHTLCDGEVAGKSSNENHAVRELYKKLVQTHNPYRVMVTICDVDSLFAERYIEQLDWTYQQYPNPGQLLYDAPINTYRNYFEADVFIRTFESARCQSAMTKIWQFQACQSNYSLTLGFAREINFWCPDNTPEDLHTTLKSFVHTHGSQTVAPVFSIICNDLVSGWGDRYTQAKRHSWGVTEAMWALTTYKQIHTPLWLKMFGFVWYDQIGVELFNPLFLLLFPGFWKFALGIKPLTQAVLFGPMALTYVYSWIDFIATEIWLFSRILPMGKSEYLPSLTLYQKVMIGVGFLVFPVTSFVSVFVFATIPRFHCLIHAFFSTELAYITAPKAVNGICSAS